MELALYLLPVTLGDTPIETVLPPYNKEINTGNPLFHRGGCALGTPFFEKGGQGNRY